MHNDERMKAEALVAMACNFGKEFSPALLTMWLDLMASYSVEDVRAAVKNVIENYEYKTIPPFAVVKKAMDAHKGQDSKTLMLQAIAEWGVVISKIGECGSYNKPQFCPTTEYVLRLLGGWAAVCQWSYKDMDFRRKEFLDLWTEAHEHTTELALGAGGVKQALAAAQPARQPIPVGTLLADFMNGGK